MAMVKTAIEIDEEALSTAAEVLGRRRRRIRSTPRSARSGSGWHDCTP